MTVAELQPALLRLKDQLRGIEATGHTVDEALRTIALRGLVPKALLERMGDLEDSRATYDAKLRWVERQVEKAHVENNTDLRGAGALQPE